MKRLFRQYRGLAWIGPGPTLSLAMIVVWSTITYRTWTDWKSNEQPLTPPPGFIALFAFGIIFVIANVRIGNRPSPTVRRALLLLEAAAALTTYALQRETFELVLLVVIAIQFAYAFEKSHAILLLLAMNLIAAVLLAQTYDRQQILENLVFYGGLQIFTFMTAGYAISARMARDVVVQVNAELLATQQLLSESSRLDERLRLSRELHDLVGYKLTALKLQLRQLAKSLTTDTEGIASRCLRLSDELLVDVRGVVSASRCGEGIDLHESLAALANNLPGPRIDLRLDESIRVPRLDQAHALLRCAQEGLTNAVRHANADHIVLSLEQTNEDITLTIEDNGCGQATPSRGNGLTGLQERLQALGGTMDLTCPNRRGLRLSVWMPLARSREMHS